MIDAKTVGIGLNLHDPLLKQLSKLGKTQELPDVLSVALLVALAAKRKAINPIIEHLKLLLVLAEQLCLCHLIGLTDKEQK
jgi:hypothetical protein